jgi:hypothetical protein
VTPREPSGLDALLELVDDEGNIDVHRIPDGCMVPLAELKRAAIGRLAVA